MGETVRIRRFDGRLLMSRITLIHGLPFSGQRERLVSLLVRHVSSTRGQPIYVLVPTGHAAASIRRSLLDACPSEAAGGVHWGTVAALAQKLYLSLSRRERPATELERELIVGSILESGRFRNLTSLASLRGVRSRLASFISLAKRNVMGPEEVSVALRRRRHGERAWEGELPDLIRAYDQRVGELLLIDPEELPSAVSEALKSGELPIPEGALVAAFGFFHLSPSALLFVETLLEKAEQGTVVVDYHPDHEERLEASKGLFEAMEEVASDVVCMDRPHSPEAAGDCDGTDSGAQIELAQAFDIRSEAELVALDVKGILRRDPGLMPSSIKIVANDLETYAPLLGETFAQHGIPLSVPGGRRLDESPVVAAALALLEAPIQNFRRHSVLRIFSMPFVEVPQDDGRLSREMVDGLARASRVIEGYEEWQTRFAQLRDVLINAPEVEPDYPDPVEEEIDALRADAGPEECEKAMAALLDVLARLKSLSGELPPSEFCKRYVEELEHFGILRSAFAPEEDGGPKRLKVGAALALSRFLAVIRELAAGLEECAPSARNLTEYYRMLRSAASSTRVDEAEPERDAVELHWGSQSATIPAEYVFVVGATESGFPGRESRVGLHSAEELREAGLFPDPPHQAQSRFLFYSYLASGRRKATVTWPASELGKTFLRSPFIDEIEASGTGVNRNLLVGRKASTVGTLADACIRIGERTSRRSVGSRADSVMQPFAQRYPDTAKGMVRAFGALEARASLPGRNPYHGVVASPDLLNALKARFAGAAFGVTRLEAYARCPFRFFAENVLELLPPVEPEESVSPLNWGGAVHRALQRFMAGRRGRGGFKSIPRPEDDADGFGAAVSELVLVFDEELSRLPHSADDAYYLAMRENLLGAGMPRGEGGFVEAFLREEAIREALGYAPSHFEVHFGASAKVEGADDLLSGPALEVRGSVCGNAMAASIMGRIDRLDLVDGSGVVVYDYKTGGAGVPGLAEVREGTSLQLPVYLLVAADLLRRRGLKGAAPCGAAYLRVRDARDTAPWFILRGRGLPDDALGRRTPDESEFGESLLGSLRFVLSYAYGIVSGLFPAAPKGKGIACRYCGYGGVCRRKEAELLEVEFPVSAEQTTVDSHSLGKRDSKDG